MGLPIGLLADAIGERATLAALSAAVLAITAVVAARLRSAGAARSGAAPQRTRANLDG
jgi:hypothetical protein